MVQNTTAPSLLPSILDALVALLPDQLRTAGLTDVIVVDSAVSSEDDGDFLLVGMADPDITDFAEAGTTEQDWITTGGEQRTETGDVTMCAVAWNGDGNIKAARDKVYAVAGCVATLCRINYDLGIETRALWLNFGRTTSLVQGLEDDGAVALLRFRIQFTARI